MSYLAILFPSLEGKRPLPLSRDQLMLLMAAVNLIFLAVDIYLAHNLNGTIRAREWIPIIFGLVAGVLLLIAGLIAFRNRKLASIIASVVLICSIIVGLLGAYFHIGLWGVSAAWVESPPDSGILRLLGDRSIRLPLSKTRAYLFMVSLGILATLISSVLDHGRAQFENPWLIPPIAVGIFGGVVAFGLGALDRPRRADIGTYFAGMVLLIVIGLIGFILHIQFDLTAMNEIVPERFLRGAPFLAPMLFANMGLVGLISILDPTERSSA